MIQPQAMQDKLDPLPAYTAGMVHATRLRWYREQAVLTQKELADKAGLTVLSISKIEQGYQEPRPSTLRKLARALRIKPRDLIDDDHDEDAVA